MTSDARLLYCKGAASGSPLVEIDERRRDLVVGDGLVLPGVSVDVDWSPEKGGRESTRVCSFLEVRKNHIFVFYSPGCLLYIIVWILFVWHSKKF